MKKIIVIFFIIVCYCASYAQQIPVTDFNFVNPFILNPAKAGDLGTRIFFLNRQQWKDISGAPETSILSFDTELEGKNVGLGLLMLIDNNNFINKTSISGTYNYKLKLGEQHFLSFAVSPGIIRTQIDFSKIRTEQINDPVLFSSVQNAVSFNADAGLNYSFKNLEFGFTALNLSAPKFNFQSQVDGSLLNYQLVQYFTGSLSYAFLFLDGNLQLQPSIIGRSTIGLPVQFDGGLNVFYKDILLTRLGYRYNSSVYLALAFNLYDDLTVGCGYEYSTGPISGYSGGTYEVIIGYRFHERKGSLNNVDRNNKKESKQIKENIENQSQKIDEILYKNAELQKEMDRNSREINSLKEEIERFKNDAKLSPEDLELLRNVKDKYEYPDNKNNDINTNDEILKSGNNQSPDSIIIINSSQHFDTESEIKGYCVIVGAYRTLESAKEGQKILIRELDLKTTILQDSAKYFYFICSGVFENPKAVVNEKIRLNELNVERFIVGRPWTYMILEGKD